MSTTASPAAAARDELAGFGGELIGPDDPTYDEARALYNAMIDKRPALIARPSGSDDAAAVIASPESTTFRSRFAAAATTAPGSRASTAAS